MNKTVKRNVMLMVMMCCMLSFTSVQTVESADKSPKPEIQYKIIRLYEKGGIDPSTLTVERGTTVIWINDSKSIAEIEFTDKKVTVVCKSPVRFSVGESGAYVSEKIFQGTVASLCFIEKGEFEYVVKRRPRRLAEIQIEPPDVKGKVIVK